MKNFFSESNIKISLTFFVATFALLFLLAFVTQTELRKELEAETYKQIEASGNTIVAELMRKTTLVSSLAENLAVAVSALPYSEENYHSLLPRLMDPAQFKHMVAGGGIWPEPNALKENTERGSFFWGREADGSLSFYNDYNMPEGQGYHNEEWYVPARFLHSGNCYWSRSYIDPYSKEPMVTCTKPLLKNDQYLGATTIDMKLEGFHQFFARESEKIGGYIFLLDQNGKFISYPNRDIVIKPDGLDHIDVDELALQHTSFEPFAKRLTTIAASTHAIAEGAAERRQEMAEYFSENSYQVDASQAEVMASAIINPMSDRGNASHLLARFQMTEDLILNEDVNVSVFHVPESYWNLVVVTPLSEDFATVSSIIAETSKKLAIPTFIIMFLCFWFIHRTFIKPLTRITNHLKHAANDPENETLLENFGKGDFGKLAEVYNEKTIQVRKVLDELSSSNDQLRIYASYDVLTGLYNRRAFESFLDQLLDSEDYGHHAVCYVDMDQFKVINDTAGHLAGDSLLKEVSQTIAKALRKDDILARIGGDEFAVIIKANNVGVALSVAERICHYTASHQFKWEDKSFRVSCSIGVLHLSTIKADKQKILSCVDAACYTAKDSGRNRVHLYLPEDHQIAQRSGEIEHLLDLREAIDGNRLFLEYQLIAGQSPGASSGVEALLRLKDSEGNTVYPGKFMMAAERYNATWQIDQWVIKQAISEFSAAKDALNLSFCSINITADALNNKKLVPSIKEALIDHHADGSTFCFEITETSAIANIDVAREQIQKIRSLGCKIALDDFGSGMSSYGYLKSLPIDYLKIDGAFVKHIASSKVDYAFVKSMHEVAQAMDIKTVAEWVEDEQTLDTLRSIGITYAQGFGISKPKALDSYREDRSQKTG